MKAKLTSSSSFFAFFCFLIFLPFLDFFAFLCFLFFLASPINQKDKVLNMVLNLVKKTFVCITWLPKQMWWNMFVIQLQMVGHRCSLDCTCRVCALMNNIASSTSSLMEPLWKQSTRTNVMVWTLQFYAHKHAHHQNIVWSTRQIITWVLWA